MAKISLLFLIGILIVFFTNTAKSNNYDQGHCEKQKCMLKSSALSIHGVILARRGSKGIKNKNLQTIGGKSLLRRAIEAMQQFQGFDTIWVSTDGDLIAQEAEDCGALVHQRSAETATDEASTISALQEFLFDHPEIDNIALIQCTSPFLKALYLDAAYQLMEQGFDTVFSVTLDYKLRWTEKSDVGLTTLNFDPWKRPRRQDMTAELAENGMFYFTQRQYVMAGILQAGSIAAVEIPKEDSLEIDTIEDLKLARAYDKILSEESTSENQ